MNWLRWASCRPFGTKVVVAISVPWARALVFTHNFDRNVFDFCGMKLSPKDFNNKTPGRAAHPGFAGRLQMNAEGVRQTAML